MNKKLGSTLIAMTIIIFMLFLTLGMFTKNFGGTAKAEVASAQTSIKEGELLDDVTASNDANDGVVDVDNTGSYHFSVKNTDDNGNVTQVKMKYKIVVETSQAEDNQTPVSVTYQLFPAKYDQTTNKYVVDNDQLYLNAAKVDDNHVEFTSTDATIPMTLDIHEKDTDKAQVDDYILKFTPENDGQFQFKIKVISEQAD